MQWVWEDLTFHGRPFRVAHYEAPGTERTLLDDNLVRQLERCEAELGACLWHDTNDAALRFLERRRPGGYLGLRVLELGAGAGVCGLGLALDGGCAVLTDVDALVPLLKVNAAECNFIVAEPVQDICSVPLVCVSDTTAMPRRIHRRAPRKRRDDAEIAEEISGKWVGENSAETALMDDGDDAEDAGPASVAPYKRPSARERRAARAARKCSAEGLATDVAVMVSEAAQGQTEEQDEAGLNITTVSTGQRGRCTVQAAEWAWEAREPSLPAAAFDVVIVCDCLYENRESWPALQTILARVSAEGADVVLASAALRRPFLEDFVALLESAGFTSVTRDASEHATVIVLCPP